MKFAVSTWNYNNYRKKGFTFTQIMDEITQSNLGIEFWLATLTPEDIKEYKTNYAGQISNVSCHTSLANTFLEETLLKEIALCQQLGAKILVVHPVSLGFTAHTWDYSYEKPHDIATFAKLESYVRLASDHGVKLALENGPIEILQEVMEFSIHRKFEDILGICIDTGHASMHWGKDTDYVARHLRTFKDHLFQLHVHDNQGFADDHSIAGSGCVPWQEMMRILGGLRETLTFVCELKTEGPPMEAAQATIRFLQTV